MPVGFVNRMMLSPGLQGHGHNRVCGYAEAAAADLDSGLGATIDLIKQVARPIRPGIDLHAVDSRFRYMHSLDIDVIFLFQPELYHLVS